MMTVKKKILVVDDEASMTRMLKRSLESTGKYEVRTENSGNAAVAAARVGSRAIARPLDTCVTRQSSLPSSHGP